MLSVPPATVSEPPPHRIALAVIISGLRPEPQTLCTLVAPMPPPSRADGRLPREPGTPEVAENHLVSVAAEAQAGRTTPSRDCPENTEMTSGPAPGEPAGTRASEERNGDDWVKDAAGRGFDFAASATRMWADFASRMMAAGLTFPPDKAPPEAARQMRSAMFEAMSRYYDEFMRSPQFLEGMKQAMDSAIAMRRQFNEILTRVHHELQGTARADIDSLMVAIRHLETRLLDRLEEVGGAVESLSERLNALESKGSTPLAAPAVREEPRVRQPGGRAADKRRKRGRS